MEQMDIIGDHFFEKLTERAACMADEDEPQGGGSHSSAHICRMSYSFFDCGISQVQTLQRLCKAQSVFFSIIFKPFLLDRYSSQRTCVYFG